MEFSKGFVQGLSSFCEIPELVKDTEGSGEEFEVLRPLSRKELEDVFDVLRDTATQVSTYLSIRNRHDVDLLAKRFLLCQRTAT